MLEVAQLVERWIVAPVVASSSLVFQPNMSTYPSGLRGQAATLLFTGSNPVVLSKYGGLAPMVERRIEDPGVTGSSPVPTTIFIFWGSNSVVRVGFL